MFFEKITNKLLTLIEKYHPFNLRYFKFLVTMTMFVLLSMILVLGWMSNHKIKEIVTDDFNTQQLMLAKHAASQIENSIDLLKRELTLLSLSPSVQYLEKPSFKNRMDIAFSIVKFEGVIEIKLIDAKNKKTYTITKNELFHEGSLFPEDKKYIQWASSREK